MDEDLWANGLCVFRSYNRLRYPSVLLTKPESVATQSADSIVYRTRFTLICSDFLEIFK